VLPTVVAGLHEVNAVDAAGVHPLLLAIGSERYVPYAASASRGTADHANALLGQGQLSLAKYLLIVAREDDANLHVRDIAAFFRHLLERVRLVERFTLPDLYDDRHAGLFGLVAERGFQSGDGRRRA